MGYISFEFSTLCWMIDVVFGNLWLHWMLILYRASSWTITFKNLDGGKWIWLLIPGFDRCGYVICRNLIASWSKVKTWTFLILTFLKDAMKKYIYFCLFFSRLLLLLVDSKSWIVVLGMDSFLISCYLVMVSPFLLLPLLLETR